LIGDVVILKDVDDTAYECAVDSITYIEIEDEDYPRI